MIKQKQAYSYTSGDSGSIIQTLNPFSPLLDTVNPDKIPQAVFKYSPFADKDTTALSFKTGATLLAAILLAGGARAISHFGDLRKLRSLDTVDKNIRNNLNNTFEIAETAGALKERKTASIQKNSNIDWYTASLPLAAALAGSIGAYTAVDKLADRHKANVLTNRLKNKSEYWWKLLSARARNARNTLSEDEYTALLSPQDFEKAEQPLISKNAGVTGILETLGVDAPALGLGWLVGSKNGQSGSERIGSGLRSALGLLATALLVTGFVGANEYVKANDKAYLKHKAYKKGLGAYASARAQQDPVTVIPTNNELFRSIDGNTNSTEAPTISPRNQEELNLADHNNIIDMKLL